MRPNVAFLDFYELLPAFLLSALVIYVVSRLTPAPNREIQAEFEQVNAL